MKGATQRRIVEELKTAGVALSAAELTQRIYGSVTAANLRTVRRAMHALARACVLHCGTGARERWDDNDLRLFAWLPDHMPPARTAGRVSAATIDMLVEVAIEASLRSPVGRAHLAVNEAWYADIANCFRKRTGSLFYSDAAAYNALRRGLLRADDAGKVEVYTEGASGRIYIVRVLPCEE